MIGKKIEKNNVTIFLNVLYGKKGKIYPAYVSKHNWNYEKWVILLMTLLILLMILQIEKNAKLSPKDDGIIL